MRCMNKDPSSYLRQSSTKQKVCLEWGGGTRRCWLANRSDASTKRKQYQQQPRRVSLKGLNRFVALNGLSREHIQLQEAHRRNHVSVSHYLHWLQQAKLGHKELGWNCNTVHACICTHRFDKSSFRCQTLEIEPISFLNMAISWRWCKFIWKSQNYQQKRLVCLYRASSLSKELTSKASFLAVGCTSHGMSTNDKIMKMQWAGL